MKKAIRQVEAILVSKDYSDAMANSRLTTEEIEKVVSEYCGKIDVAPDSYFQNVKAIPIAGTDPQRWAVDYDLWIDGKSSDLTLSLELTTTDSAGNYTASIEDLHVQ